MSEGESKKARPSGQSLSDPSRIGANEMQEEPAAADKDPVVSNPARVKSGTGGRLDVLDGLRGIAALAVVAYHFFARWAEPHFHPTLYQHGDAIAEWLPLQIAGRFGVYLFFLISGFVIMMTLERATGVLDFTARRAARLWPPMLVCATLSTLIINWSDVAYVYENVARWHVTPVEYVSSIFFIPPDMTADLFGIQQSDTPRWVEGVYWTLWSEVRFYAVIALAFLAQSATRLPVGLGRSAAGVSGGRFNRQRAWRIAGCDGTFGYHSPTGISVLVHTGTRRLAVARSWPSSRPGHRRDCGVHRAAGRTGHRLVTWWSAAGAIRDAHHDTLHSSRDAVHSVLDEQPDPETADLAADHRGRIGVIPAIFVPRTPRHGLSSLAGTSWRTSMGGCVHRHRDCNRYGADHPRAGGESRQAPDHADFPPQRQNAPTAFSDLTDGAELSALLKHVVPASAVLPRLG